jgi:HEAT repeat protein
MTRRHGEIVTRGVLHLMKEGWRRFAGGLVLFLAVCIFGHNLAAQTGTTSDWPEIEIRLIRQLSGDTEQKRSALFKIRNFRNKQASRLAISALKDTDEIVRATAAASVIFLPKIEAVNALTPLLNDRAEFVRREAAYALGNVGSTEAAAPLLGHLQKEKLFEVRNAIVVALGQSGDPSAIEPLVKILKRSPKEDEEFLRRSAARSIGQIAQIIRTGKKSVLTPQNFLPDKYKDTGESEIANSSIQLQFIDAVAVLTQVLKSKNESDDTRREAAFALGAIGDKTSLSVLQENRNSPDPYLAEICKEALLKIEKPE